MLTCIFVLLLFFLKHLTSNFYGLLVNNKYKRKCWLAFWRFHLFYYTKTKSADLLFWAYCFTEVECLPDTNQYFVSSKISAELRPELCRYQLATISTHPWTTKQTLQCSWRPLATITTEIACLLSEGGSEEDPFVCLEEDEDAILYDCWKLYFVLFLYRVF